MRHLRRHQHKIARPEEFLRIADLQATAPADEIEDLRRAVVDVHDRAERIVDQAFAATRPGGRAATLHLRKRRMLFDPGMPIHNVSFKECYAMSAVASSGVWSIADERLR